MPFTPFHFGPALFLGLPLRKYMHVPTFILANVILDVEPFLVLFYRLSYPLHGYSHTLLLAIVVGITLGYAMFLLEKTLHPFYKMFLLRTDDQMSLKSFFCCGCLGHHAPRLVGFSTVW